MEDQDKIVDLVDYGECVIVTSGRTPSERAASAVLSSFGIMSCLPRTCVVSMPPHISIFSDYEVFGPCVVRQDLAENLSEIHLAINGDILDTVIVPVRLVNKTGDEGCGPTLACRGGLILDVMRRIAVTGGGPTVGVNTVEELHHWVRRQVRCVSICIFVLVKQVNRVPARPGGQSIELVRPLHTHMHAATTQGMARTRNRGGRSRGAHSSQRQRMRG